MDDCRPDQLDFLTRAQSAMRRQRHVCGQAGCGWGKCLAPGTPILMFDGTTKAVEAVVVGDRLMGPDSSPRWVLSLAAGRETMCRVVPTKGDPYVVNESHILSLKIKRHADKPHEVVNLSVRDYLSAPEKFRVNAKGYRVGVEFAHRPVPVDPYFLGLWLADGNSDAPIVTSADDVIRDYLIVYAGSLGMSLSGYQYPSKCPRFRIVTAPDGRAPNPLLDALRGIGVISNKHIPHAYLTNSRESRLQLLAGLIDGDGHLHGDSCYQFDSTNRRLAENVLWLARSLGFAAYIGRGEKTCQTGASCVSYRVGISGHTNSIPCRIARKKAQPRRIDKDALVYGVRVERLDVGDYFGFTIDGDGLFLLGDFTVTHNTHVIAEASRRSFAKGRRVLVIAHRRRLIQQISDRLTHFGVPHGVIMADLPDALAARNDHHSPVQVASKDTLLSRAGREGLPLADLVIPDECHNVLGAGYSALMRHYDAAYWFGLTATPVAGDGRGLGGFFGELVCAPPVSQLIAAGTIVPFRVYAALEMAEARRVGGKVKPAGDPVAQWRRHAEGRPTVLFAPRVADSESVVKAFTAAGIPAVHIDAHSSEAARDAASDGLASGEIKVVSQVGLWTEGVDVPCVAVVQLLAKCGSLVKYLQAVWRAGRAFAGKTCATVIDHCGAVFDHGFPDEDIEWALTPGDPVKRDSSEGGEREPFVCTSCGLVYSGAASCPGCGSSFAINRKMYQPDLFAHLVELDRDYTAAVSNESDQRQWTKILYQFARSSKSLKAAVAAFRRRTGKWPNEAGVEPLYDRGDMGEAVVDVFPQFGAPAPRAVAPDLTPSLFTGEE